MEGQFTQVAQTVDPNPASGSPTDGTTSDPGNVPATVPAAPKLVAAEPGQEIAIDIDPE